MSTFNYERFEHLVGALTVAREYGTFDGMQFFMNKTDHHYGFSRKEEAGCVMIEDWERYYKFDAAKEYENPSEFVAECIIEEALNKIQLEAEYNEVIDQLSEKYNS